MFVGPAFVAVSPGTKKTYEEIENWPTRYKSQLPLDNAMMYFTSVYMYHRPSATVLRVYTMLHHRQ